MRKKNHSIINFWNIIIIIWQFKQRIIDLGDSVFTFSSTCRVSNRKDVDLTTAEDVCICKKLSKCNFFFLEKLWHTQFQNLKKSSKSLVDYANI